MHTPLCDLLGLEVPILSVGFGSAATPELAAAVSNAGGLGVVGMSAYAHRIPGLADRTRELTDRPFGGNVVIADLEESFGASEEDREETRATIAAILEARVPVLVLFWGDPAPFVEPAHAAGVKLLIQVGSVEEARAASAAGVDAVIVQGVEAGGHVRATESLWDVLPRAVEAVAPTPVIASGGIGDGAAIARALALGAIGVSLGTRFVACEEAFVHPAYKRKVVESRGEDTFLGELFDGGWPNAPHRAIKAKTYAEWEAAGRPPPGRRPGEGEPIGRVRGRDLLRYHSAMLTPEFEGDAEYAPLWAGLSLDRVNEIKPAAQIVADLVREAEAYSVTTYSNDAQQTSANTAS